jgi:hypothetical protein
VAGFAIRASTMIVDARREYARGDTAPFAW